MCTEIGRKRNKLAHSSSSYFQNNKTPSPIAGVCRLQIDEIWRVSYRVRPRLDPKHFSFFFFQNVNNVLLHSGPLLQQMSTQITILRIWKSSSIFLFSNIVQLLSATKCFILIDWWPTGSLLFFSTVGKYDKKRKCFVIELNLNEMTNFLAPKSKFWFPTDLKGRPGIEWIYLLYLYV